MSASVLPVVYATVAPDALAEFIAERFALPRPVRCSLLNRGFNDVFAVSCPDAQYVARVSGRRGRGPADVASETAFLAYLDRVGVPVAAPVPAGDGALFGEAGLPQDDGAVVLFRFAEGRRPELDAPEDAAAQGASLARVHAAAEHWPDRETGRYRLDLEHLLHRPLAAILALPFASAQTRDFMTALATRLVASIAARDDLGWTRCHGDCHGMNARIRMSGPRAGEAVLFDFDDGGFGYLAYDLAVHLWAQVSFQRRRHPMWHAFIDGYRSVRSIHPSDFDAVPLFVPVRHLWLLGEYAEQVAFWGSEILSAALLEREVQFLRAWETERLSPQLV